MIFCSIKNVHKSRPRRGWQTPRLEWVVLVDADSPTFCDVIVGRDVISSDTTVPEVSTLTRGGAAVAVFAFEEAESELDFVVPLEHDVLELNNVVWHGEGQRRKILRL